MSRKISGQSTQRGFTLVELMLAMAFISMLLLAIAMTTVQIGHIYNRGLTMKEVNQSGRAISDDIQRTIIGARPLNLADGSSYRPQIIDQTGSITTAGGRLCFGSYSYIWNLGLTIDKKPGDTNINKYTDGSLIRLAKVYDPGKSYCTPDGHGVFPAPARSSATELIGIGNSSLALQSVTIRQQVATTSGQALMTVDFTLGTNDQSLLDAGSTTCKPPADGGYLEYCSVNSFQVVARAGNQAGQ